MKFVFALLWSIVAATLAVSGADAQTKDWSKIRIGTEVIITFPPERVMSALAPMAEEAPSIQPEPVVAEDKRRVRNKPIMSAGTGL